MDFHDRLLSEVQKLDGVSAVHLVQRGKSAATRSFRRHPHLAVTLVNGKTFQHTVKQRPKDTWHRFLNYLCSIRKRTREHLGSALLTSPTPAPKKQRKRARKQPPSSTRASGPLPSTVPSGSTRLDLDPWAPLRRLVAN